VGKDRGRFVFKVREKNDKKRGEKLTQRRIKNKHNDEKENRRKNFPVTKRH
jgi:hypothetical protein